MKKIAAAVCIILCLSFVVSSCGKSGETMKFGEYEADAELVKTFGGSRELVAEFLAPYAFADSLADFDYKTEEFKALCATRQKQILFDDYGGEEKALERDLEAEGISKELYERIVEQDTLKSELVKYLEERGGIETNKYKIRAAILKGDAARIKKAFISKDAAGPYTDAPSSAEEQLKYAKELYISGAKTFERIVGDFAPYAPIGDVLGNFGDSFIVMRGLNDKEFEDLCFSLEEYEVSDVFEYKDGYCLVKRFPIDEEELDASLDELSEMYRDGQFNSLILHFRDELLSNEG